MAVETALVSFECLSIIIKAYSLNFSVFRSKNKIFFMSKSNGTVAKKRCVGLFFKCGTAFGTAVAAAHDFLHIASNIGPAIVSLHCAIHTTLSRVAEYGAMM